MCSMYWTLNANITCPKCSHNYNGELQTHFMGEIGSCMNYYNLNQSVDELKGVSVVLDGRNDSFIDECPKCNEFNDYGAKITKGKVKKVWAIEGLEE